MWDVLNDSGTPRTERLASDAQSAEVRVQSRMAYSQSSEGSIESPVMTDICMWMSRRIHPELAQVRGKQERLKFLIPHSPINLVDNTTSFADFKGGDSEGIKGVGELCCFIYNFIGSDTNM